MNTRLSLIACVILSSACVPTPAATAGPTPIYTPFDSTAIAWSKGQGTGVIEGQAFAKTRGGDVKYGAGNEVALTPVSPHSTEWHNAMLQGESLAPGQLHAYQRRTTADGSGRFRFENLPAGEYFVTTSVTWEVPSSYGLRKTGGPIGAKATAADGKTTTVIVN